VAEFDFLGKDSVPWHKELELSPLVQETLEELVRGARPSSSSGNGDNGHPTRDLPQLFPDIGSRHINAFLSRIQKGLSAKVFRTHHATHAVMRSLDQAAIQADDPEYAKWEAVATANFQAAVLCNHTKKDTGNWETRQQRYQERLDKAIARRERYEAQLAERREALQLLEVEAATRRSISKAELGKVDPENESRYERALTRYKRTVARYEKRIATAKGRIQTSRQRIQRAEQAIGKIRAQWVIAAHKRTWNLGTSLKSYIDPRVYVGWGRQVDYDVLERYYPKALRRKFAWAAEVEREKDG
jgi:DNA topoisomerase-1